MNANSIKNVVIAGAGGLVGSNLLSILISDLTVNSILVLSSGPKEIRHPKVRVRQTDYRDLSKLIKDASGADVLYCCVGTTMAIAGTKEAFKKVDYDIPLNLAKFASRCGIPRFIVVSSVGADPESNNFYLRTKGEMERDVARTGPFKKVAFVRPSLLLGERQDLRKRERLGQLLAVLCMPFFKGKLEKYKPVSSSMVARAMTGIFNSVNNQKVYEFRDLEWLGR